MARPTRIVHLLLNLQAGGVQIQLLQLLRHFPAGYEHDVVSLQRRGELEDAFRELGCKVRYAAKGADRREIPPGRLGRLLRRRPADILHAHDAEAIVQAAEAAPAAEAPALLAHYHTPRVRAKSETGNGPETRALGRCARLVFNCAVTRDDLLSRAPLAAELPFAFVPNSVDPRQFFPEPDQDEAGPAGERRRQPPVAGILARLDPVKNHPMLIEAAARLLAAGLPLEVWIVGGGRPRRLERLRERVEALGLSQRVLFKGYHPDPSRLLRRFDVLVLCSRFEGMPLAVLEAWACGVPVVATRVQGLRELIRDDVDGLLCEPDDPLSLAAAIRRVLEEPGLRERLVREGRERAAMFTPERCVADLERLYCEVLRGSPERRAPSAALRRWWPRSAR